MEFLEGKSLTEYLKENIKISVENGVGLILSICDAVKTIHRAGILHRDISPDNIIIPPDFPSGAVKLIDFGAARFSADEKVTLNQQIMKPGYSPPEQYLAKNRENEQIDIYALGATLFHILTGEKPEESTNRKVVDNIPVPGELNNEIPEHVSNAILKAMAVDLHLRFKTVDEFVQALTGKVKVQAPETEMKTQNETAHQHDIHCHFAACRFIHSFTRLFSEKRCGYASRCFHQYVVCGNRRCAGR